MFEAINVKIAMDSVDLSTGIVVIKKDGTVHQVAGMIRDVVLFNDELWYTELTAPLIEAGLTEDDLCTDPTAEPVVAFVLED